MPTTNERLHEELHALAARGLTFAHCMVEFGVGGEGDESEEAAYAEAARRLHQKDGVCEVDPVTIVSVGEDDGAYVMAWVWVSAEDAGLNAELDKNQDRPKQEEGQTNG